VHGAQRRSRTASSPPEGFILDGSEHRATLAQGRARLPWMAMRTLARDRRPHGLRRLCRLNRAYARQSPIAHRATRQKIESRIDRKREIQKVVLQNCKVDRFELLTTGKLQSTRSRASSSIDRRDAENIPMKRRTACMAMQAVRSELQGTP
jgi:hypothetical protein